MTPKEKRAAYMHTYMKRWREKNRDRYNEIQANWRNNNRERYNEHGRNYRERNPEQNRVTHNKSWHKYRSRLGGDDIDIETLYERDKGECQLCNQHCTREDASIDHKIPVSKEGPHTWDNVQLAHLKCNIIKGNRT